MATQPWEMDWSQGAGSAPTASSQPSNSGPIYGAPPKPTEPKEPPVTFSPISDSEAGSMGLPTNQKYQRSSRGEVSAIGGTKTTDDTDKQRKYDDARASSIQQISSTIDAIDKASGLAGADKGWWETGRSGAVVRSLPEIAQAGSDAKALEGYLSTVNANTAFSKLQEMRQNSPTGGAVGNVSDSDMRLLQSTISSLDPNQDQATFMRNLATNRQAYLDILAKLDPSAAQKYQTKDDGLPAGAYVQAGGLYDKEGNYLGLAVNMPEGPVDGGGSAPPAAGNTPPPSNPNNGAPAETIGDKLAQGAGSVVEGIASVPALVVDPLATTLGRALGYKDYTSDFAGRVREDLGLPKNTDETANTIIKGGSSALTGAGAARGLAGLVGSAPVSNALSQYGATPIRDAAAGAGAAAGGEVGKEYGGVPGQVAGTLAGGVAGYAGANSLARLALGERAPSSLMQAADQFGVKPIPADVGGVGTRMASGAIGRTLGGIPLAEGAERSIASAGAARNRLASEIGTPAENIGAGQAARRGFEDFTKVSQTRADQLYDAIPIAPEAKVQLANTRTALADVTRGMQSNPELSKLWANHPRLRATLEALTPEDVAVQGRQDFTAAARELTNAQENYRRVLSAVSSPADQVAARKAVDAAQAKVEDAQHLASTPPKGGELSWQDMNRFRSIVGEIIGQPGISRDGSDIAALRKLYGALSTDMEVTAAQAGGRVLSQFNRANTYWRGRQNRIDDVFSALLGNRDQRSDEAAFLQINQWAKSGTGDFSRLARSIRSMPDEEANTIRATVVQRLGQVKPSKGNSEVFSPAEFSTQWNSLSDRAKSVLFPSKTHRADLDKFADLMGNMKRANDYQNFSNTALSGNAAVQGVFALTHPIAAAILAGSQFGLGKLLASPRFARAIASTSKLTADQAARKLSSQLEIIAAQQPALAADARGLQQHLGQQFSVPHKDVALEDVRERQGNSVR